MTWQSVEAHNARVFEQRFGKKPIPETVHAPVERERDLHDALIEFYERQWPRWKVIYARQDKRSTIPVGCQDHTVFANNGRVFCFELKKKNEKPDKEQLIWHKEMQMLGHIVHVIRSEQEFLEIVK